MIYDLNEIELTKSHTPEKRKRQSGKKSRESGTETKKRGNKSTFKLFGISGLDDSQAKFLSSHFAYEWISNFPYLFVSIVVWHIFHRLCEQRHARKKHRKMKWWKKWTNDARSLRKQLGIKFISIIFYRFFAVFAWLCRKSQFRVAWKMWIVAWENSSSKRRIQSVQQGLYDKKNCRNSVCQNV